MKIFHEKKKVNFLYKIILFLFQRNLINLLIITLFTINNLRSLRSISSLNPFFVYELPLSCFSFFSNSNFSHFF